MENNAVEMLEPCVSWPSAAIRFIEGCDTWKETFISSSSNLWTPLEKEGTSKQTAA